MKKEYKLALVLLGIIVAIIFLNLVGGLSFFNHPINRLIAGLPDKSCSDDSDCALKGTQCVEYSCGEAVNKNWKPFCLFKIRRTNAMYKPCPSPGHDFNVRCVNNLCQQVWTQTL